MRMIKDFLNMLKIRTKIILLYISVLVLSFIISFAFFNIMNLRIVEKEVGDVAMQTVGALKGNLDLIFENVSQFSNFIYFDKNVQKALSDIEYSGIDPLIQQTIQKSLINMLLSGDYISSVFVFDNFENYYYSYKVGPIFVNKGNIKDSDWYQKMKKANGELLFIHKSEDVLSYPTIENKNYITLIREIADVDTYSPLAILLITVDEKTIQDYFDKVGKEYNSQFCIVDSNDNYIIKPSGYNRAMDNIWLGSAKEETGYRTVVTGKDKTIVVQQDLEINDWRLIGALPMNLNEFPISEVYRPWILLIGSINLLFIFACSVVLTRLIFNPLNKVQKHMQLVEDGQLIEMKIEINNKNEINNLKKVFNQMIESIKELISKVKNEEKIIAKHELDILQAQINPHFLYNTLDAVSALALIGDNENCLNITSALGNFYRNSLNSGLDLVRIKDEIECIDSYVTILNIRYDNKINIIYDIEEEIMEYKILKLILQPIVENAVYHGIRTIKGIGNISIKGYIDEEEIIFIVTDDGLGMSEDRVNEIIEGKTQTGKSGFGLYSSTQRISLYYDIENPITITSEIGSGTEITVRVKAIKGERIDEN